MSQRFPLIITIITILALLFLAMGYWGRWVSHPVAGLNILGVDLPEYVKFVPEARYGIIPTNRLVFFTMPIALTLGLILFASSKMPIPLWLRIMAGFLAIPVALSMLPPAWTPGLLLTPEFRTQTLILMALVIAAFLIPLWKILIPDRGRGVMFILLGTIPILAIRSFRQLMPAIEKLYNHPLPPGPGFYALIIGMGLMILAGIAYLTKKEQY